ncbi:MAG: Bifunctional NAD(P)H-hydrate repair enzyme [Verrucomicrobiales bacterium]|nr:Bifunctional NAD(P)H-hydrate repair enzyme [Verrucomicrobiales bacterium]
MPVPVITVAQMREWEKAAWATGVSEGDVIEKVGRAIAHRLLELTNDGDFILVLAGKGHNGDDARAAVPHLKGREVRVVEVTDPNTALPQVDEELSRKPKWVVDALFGIGLNRPLDEHWTALINKINSSGMRVLAVDVPSGLNTETGKAEGAAIHAELTLTVGAPKLGLLNATDFVGRLEVANDVGLIPCPIESELQWTLASDFIAFPPLRKVASHKGTYGHAALFAGSVGYHGAAVLMTHGAQRAQPGLVTVYPQDAVYLPVASQLQSAMVHPWIKDPVLPKSITAIGLGPGLASEEFPQRHKDFLCTIWQTSMLPVVADASALSWLMPGPALGKTVRVMTPHPGEAARLLGTSSDAVQADRIGALRELSRKFRDCFVVLKGHQTLVGRGHGPVFINSTGNAYLAQGGSGDALTGFITGLLAQPQLQHDPITTIRYAVFEHGAAADRLSQQRSNWTVEDLILELGRKLLSL